jgi:hypothetical protein
MIVMSFVRTAKPAKQSVALGSFGVHHFQFAYPLSKPTTNDIMDQLLQQQHAQAGSDNLSMDQLKEALGGILSFIKAKFDGLDFSQITSALPEAHDLVNKAEADNASARAAGGGGGGGGFLAGALNMLEQATQTDRDDAAAAAPAPVAADGSAPAAAPVDSMSELIACLTKAGINPQQVMSLLPVVAGFLKQHAGVDVSSVLGTPAATHTAGEEGGAATAAAPAPAAADGANDAVGNLMSQAQGFLSNFQK